MGIKFKFQNGHFYTGPINRTSVLAEAKWRYDAEKRIYYTPSYVAAARLNDLMGGNAKKQLQRKFLQISSWPSLPPHPPHETPLKFQPKAAQFVLKRNRSYLAAEPGLGKTIIAMLVLNALIQARKAGWQFVYLCPPFMVQNVVEEFNKWKFQQELHARLHNIGWYEPADMIVYPDSKISDWMGVEEIEEYVARGVASGKRTMLFVDEAQRFGQDSMRTQSLFGYVDKKHKDDFGWKVHHPGVADLFHKICYMSGTPVQNKTVELFPVLSHSAPDCIDFMNIYQYGHRYCGMKKNDYGKFEFKGSTRTDELSNRIKPRFMLRLRKKLLNLPPKVEELLIVAKDMSARCAAMDRNILKHYSPEDLMEAELKAKHGLEDIHLATYRRLLGLEKIPVAIEVIEGILENTDENLLVFALHVEVTEGLAKRLKAYKPILVNGSVPSSKRLALCKLFQADKSRRLLVANIDACGIGYTLTKATRVLFVEFSYVPTKNDQASDRAHRHGQKDSVYAQFLVYRNSADRKVIESNMKKRKAIEQI